MSAKKRKWIYWGVTAPFVGLMAMSGVMYLFATPEMIQGLATLGYPAYLLKILGVAKVLGAAAIIYGRVPVLKEWAYAGFTIHLLGASASHFFSNDTPVKTIVPLIFLGLVLTSYRLWKKNA